MEKVWDMLAGAAGNIVTAILVAVIGFFVIKLIMNLLRKLKGFEKLDQTTTRFILNGIKWLLYVILIIAVITILGVPMASVIAVLASAGLAVGMALQGALSNLAGGILLMIMRPFKVGDYIEAAGAGGVVQAIHLFYTVILTLDNKRVTIPNGSLMNSNVTDFTAEPTRRVDLVFSCAKSVEFTVRVWCETANYWDLYFELNQIIVEAFAAKGVQAPALRILNEKA